MLLCHTGVHCSADKSCSLGHGMLEIYISDYLNLLCLLNLLQYGVPV